MGFENASSDQSADIVRIFRGSGYRGTGLLVSPDFVLTCVHVVDRDTDRPLGVRLAGADFQSLIVETKDEGYDLALIRIPRQEARKPVCFLTGLKRRHENNLRSLSWQAIGHDARYSETFVSAASVNVEPRFQWDNSTETLLEVQVDLGLPNGFSGAPVLIEVSGKSLCIGVVTQGGVDSSKSRIRFSDCIVGFLEGSGLKVEVQDASKALEPKAIATTLARQRQNNTDRQNQYRSWWWIAAIGLLGVAVFAGWYVFLKPLSDVKPDGPHTESSKPVSSPIPKKRSAGGRHAGMPSWPDIKAGVSAKYPNVAKLEPLGDFVCTKSPDSTTQVWDWPWDRAQDNADGIYCRQDASGMEQGPQKVLYEVQIAAVFEFSQGKWKPWKYAIRRR